MRVLARLAVVAVALAAAAITIGATAPVARVVTALFCAMAPGVVLVWWRTTPLRCPLGERWMLAAGAIVSADIFVAFLLNEVAGLNRRAWVITMSGETVLITALSMVSQWRSTRAGRPRPGPTSAEWLQGGRRAGLLVGCGALFGVVAIIISVNSSATVPGGTFAELWAVPSASASGRPIAEIGVTNGEASARAFDVAIAGAVGSPSHLQLRLEPGQSWHLVARRQREKRLVVKLYVGPAASDGRPHGAVLREVDLAPVAP